MTGLEKIISKIDSDTAEKSNEIISNAHKQADEIYSKIISDAEKRASEIIDNSKAEASRIFEISASRSEQIKKQNILKLKTSIIDEVINFAIKKINSLRDEDYFAVLIKLIEKYAVDGKYEILFCKKDRIHLTEEVKQEMQNKAFINNAELIFTQETANIENGFILRYGLIEINCSFKALVEEKRSELKEMVNKILFSEV